MKLSLFVLSALVITTVACNKDRFQTKPTIRLKSISDFVPLNGNFQLTLECTDKEGDVQDSLIIIKKRLNKRVVATLRDTIRYKFPIFPKNTRTEVQALVEYQHILSADSPPFIPGANPPRREPDTLILRLAVRDMAGNTSDTIDSPVIYIIR